MLPIYSINIKEKENNFHVSIQPYGTYCKYSFGLYYIQHDAAKKIDNRFESMSFPSSEKCEQTIQNFIKSYNLHKYTGEMDQIQYGHIVDKLQYIIKQTTKLNTENFTNKKLATDNFENLANHMIEEFNKKEKAQFLEIKTLQTQMEKLQETVTLLMKRKEKKRKTPQTPTIATPT